MINNAAFTVLKALLGTVEASGPNAVLFTVSALLFAWSLLWLRRARLRL